MVLLPRLIETQSCSILIVSTAWVGGVSAWGVSLHRGTSHTGEIWPRRGHTHTPSPSLCRSPQQKVQMPASAW